MATVSDQVNRDCRWRSMQMLYPRDCRSCPSVSAIPTYPAVSPIQWRNTPCYHLLAQPIETERFWRDCGELMNILGGYARPNICAEDIASGAKLGYPVSVNQADDIF